MLQERKLQSSVFIFSMPFSMLCAMVSIDGRTVSQSGFSVQLGHIGLMVQLENLASTAVVLQ
jgi:hypothetical protein